MAGQAYCYRCNSGVHRGDKTCPQCNTEIIYWKCGSCGNMLSKFDEDRCHNYHPQAYDSNGSNFQTPSDTLNPWRY